MAIGGRAGVGGLLEDEWLIIAVACVVALRP